MADEQAKTEEITTAIHCPEMNDYKGHLWVYPPNLFAPYWTIGYRLERDNRTEFGYHPPTTLIEVYYAKIKPEVVSDPEWLPKFAGEFKARFYEQLEKVK